MAEEPRTSRTSVVLPEDLWLRAKDLANQRHSDLRALIIEGLEWVLSNADGSRQRQRDLADGVRKSHTPLRRTLGPRGSR